MVSAFATPAVPAPYPLVDLDDLHDADLDGVLTEQLSEAVAAAQALAALAVRPGREALSVHALGARLVLLAIF